jgi:hypothetical protein
MDKADRRGNNSISKYKAAPCRYLGVNPDSPANYLVYVILRKRIITRNKWIDIEEELEVRLPDRIRDRDVLDADETLQ